MAHRLFLSVFFIACLSASALGQRAKLESHLYNDREQPEGRVGVQAMPADTVFTASDGHFRIIFPEGVGPGEPVTIVVEKPDWVVYQPTFGETTTQDLHRHYEDSKNTRVYIALRGSKLLLGPSGISNAIALLQKNLSKANNKIARLVTLNRKLKDDKASLIAQNSALNGQLVAAAEREREDQEITVFLNKYASVYGFTKAQVLIAVQQWAQPNPNDDRDERALKMLWNRDYAGARALTEEGAQEKINDYKQVAKQQAAIAKQQTERVRDIIHNLIFIGITYDREDRFREALQEYAKVEQFLGENNIPREDYKTELADVKFYSANDKDSLGRFVGGEEARRLLTEAIADYRQLLTYYTIDQSPQEWAWAQMNLANTLQDLVNQVGGPDTLKYLREAEAAYRETLKLRSIKGLSQSCSCQPINLGTVLYNLGRMGGPAKVMYFQEAEAAFRETLAYVTSETSPQEWVWAQSSLALVLQDLARAGGPDSLRYLQEAEKIYREVVTFSERNSTPQSCGCVYADLGTVLQDLGRMGGPDALGHFKDAEKAYNDALKFSTRQSDARAWARTKAALASVIQDMGRLGGPDSLKYFKDAEANYHEALEVLTPEMYPQDRVQIEASLGTLLQDLGRMGGPDSLKYLKDAEAVLRDVVKVTRLAAIPQECGCTQGNLGSVLQDIGHLGGPDSLKYLKEAEESFREALTISTREADAQRWIRLEVGLASVLQDLGRASGTDGAKYFKDAETILLEAQATSSYDTYPEEWALVRTALAANRYALKDIPGAVKLLTEILSREPDSEEAFFSLNGMYHEELFDFTAAYALNEQWLARHGDSIPTQVNFAESQFTVGRFAESIQLIDRLLAEPAVPDDYKIGLRTIEIADLLATRQKTSVVEKLDALVTAVAEQPTGWTFEGTKHFINQNEELAPYRVWLVRLMDAVKIQDRESRRQTLQELQAEFKKLKERSS